MADNAPSETGWRKTPALGVATLVLIGFNLWWVLGPYGPIGLHSKYEKIVEATVRNNEKPCRLCGRAGESKKDSAGRAWILCPYHGDMRSPGLTSGAWRYRYLPLFLCLAALCGLTLFIGVNRWTPLDVASFVLIVPVNAGLFWIALAHGADLPASPAMSSRGSDPVPKALRVGSFLLEVPSNWEIASGADKRTARKQVEASARQMAQRFHESDASIVGIEEFCAIEMADNAGWFLAYTLRIPPQQDYLERMAQDLNEKVSWGKQRGIVIRVNEQGPRRIGGAEVFKVDTQMRGGARAVGIYYWSRSAPGIVGTISVIIEPGGYDKIRSSLAAVLASLRIE